MSRRLYCEPGRVPMCGVRPAQHAYRTTCWSRPLILALTLLAFLAFLRVPSLQAQENWHWDGVSRVVAVADVHGAYDELVEVLRAADVIDDSNAWSAGATHLVSLGDLLDRGASSRAVMDLLMRLEREAAAEGGAVHVVLGNHDLMNLTGDLRYVSAEEYAAFAADEPADVRAAAFDRFRQTLDDDTSDDEARGRFEARYPPGYFAHRLAFRPGGRYGDWLLAQPAIVVVNGTAFVHGGLSELVARASADDINARIRSHLTRYFALRDELAGAGVLPELDMERDLATAREALEAAERGEQNVDEAMIPAIDEFLTLAEAPELGLEGPLWYRGAVYCNPAVETPVLEASLEALDAERVVVGHTVTEDRRVRAAYDGRLIMLDTGMLADHYAGRPAALIIEAGETIVQYLGPEERRAPEPARIYAFGLTEDEIVAALERGEVELLGREALGADSARAEVRHEGREIEAAFFEQHGGGAEAELAAHALDRQLGFHLVPPTVEREIQGTAGALQVRAADAITETQRLERSLPAGTWCALEPQLNLMRAFDILLFNTGRSAENVLYSRDVSYLRLTGHGEAFGPQRRPNVEDGSISLAPALADALMELDRPRAEDALGAWLDGRRIRALLARRDVLLERASGGD